MDVDKNGEMLEKDNVSHLSSHLGPIHWPILVISRKKIEEILEYFFIFWSANASAKRIYGKSTKISGGYFPCKDLA